VAGPGHTVSDKPGRANTISTNVAEAWFVELREGLTLFLLSA
jgi:hypothetical protein